MQAPLCLLADAQSVEGADADQTGGARIREGVPRAATTTRECTIHTCIEGTAVVAPNSGEAGGRGPMGGMSRDPGAAAVARVLGLRFQACVWLDAMIGTAIGLLWGILVRSADAVPCWAPEVDSYPGRASEHARRASPIPVAVPVDARAAEPYGTRVSRRKLRARPGGWSGYVWPSSAMGGAVPMGQST